MAEDAVFEALRPRLLRLAHRMLGSRADAEDMVQEAWLRWQAADRAAIRAPEAFLRTVLARLCLNELASARRRRETYPGPWLPEPLVDGAEEEWRGDITLPLILALERLSPLERAAYLLHDIFGMGFAEVAEAIGRDPAACRQLASRARGHVRAARPRFAVPPGRGQEIAAAFYRASREGDMQALSALLAEDVAAHADGGGRVPASPAPLFGRDAVLARHAEMAAEFARSPSRLLRYARIDGLPGFVTIEAGGLLQTTALEIGGGRILGIYVMRNPDKLRHLAGAHGIT
ncbi:sigma-70 family RNA polymerase sigma factor [Poseidonocella sp. HB161398]|uniref:sigma-70 family RNA polymerase sigma factor n=1 Tax=Poseidonocella sp. HB161398 TaxID=2320855 RepID=UPI0011083308|nr:sigma-70 family RNA polymerase sigma factor [Poseidonocella sp. HB161398]